MELLARVARFATNSVRRMRSLIVALCSVGLLGVGIASGGNEEEKFHSSSSLETAAGFG